MRSSQISAWESKRLSKSYGGNVVEQPAVIVLWIHMKRR